MLSRLVRAVLVCVLAIVSARAEIEFVGIFTASGSSRFALSEGPGQGTSWHTLEQSFAGYSIASFDEKTNTLVLTKDSTTLRVQLKDDAKTKEGTTSVPELTGKITLGQGTYRYVSPVAMAYDQETVLPLPNGYTWRITPKRTPDGNIQYSMVREKRVVENGVTSVHRESTPTVRGIANQQFEVIIGDVDFAFDPTAK